MATYLYRLGKLSFRRRGLVLALWLAVIAALGAGAFTLSRPTADSFEIPGTEAQQAQDLLATRFPQAGAGNGQALVVFAAPAGTKITDPRWQATIAGTVAELRAGAQVATVSDPAATVNAAGTVAYAQVTYKVPAPALTEADRDALTGAGDAARAAGLTVETGGQALQAPVEMGVGEVIGFGVAALVLLITFGSLVAAGLPLLTAVFGVAAAMAGVQIAGGFIDLSSNTPILALMLGLAVAIDYALFIVSRYRHELALGRAPLEAAGRATGTAGSAVTFAGLTVVIALAALAVVNIPFLTQMGLAAAGAVVVAVVIALTLLPAMLGFAGSRVQGRRAAGGAPAGRDPEGAPRSNRWAETVTRRPVLWTVASVLGLLVVAIPALDLRLGLPGDNVAGPQTTQRKAYDLLAAGFGPGFNGPLVVVVDAAAAGDPRQAADSAARTVRGLPDVAAVGPAVFNPAGDTAVLQVVPASAPDSERTTDLVHAIRDAGPAVRRATGAELAVTGTTAVNIDVSARMGAALGPYLAVIVVLAFLLLTVLFRSLLVPVKAIAGFLLSVGATFGAVVAVFQWGWLAGVFGVAETGPVVSMIPVLLIGIVFGLAMDYEVFLVTRMREEHVHGAAPRDAVTGGFTHGARVVTAAAIIMISVFSGFVLAPDPVIKSIGFALAAAILFDAFVVRMTLVPAVMTLLGRRAWSLPGWLDRLLPDVDVEGERLRTIPAATPELPELIGAGR